MTEMIESNQLESYFKKKQLQKLLRKEANFLENELQFTKNEILTNMEYPRLCNSFLKLFTQITDSNIHSNKLNNFYSDECPVLQCPDILCRFKYCYRHAPQKYTIYTLNDLTLLRREDDMFFFQCSRIEESYLRVQELFEHPTFLKIFERCSREYFAAKRIQRIVRNWLEKPIYSNGHVGFHCRKSWKECERI